MELFECPNFECARLSLMPPLQRPSNSLSFRREMLHQNEHRYNLFCACFGGTEGLWGYWTFGPEPVPFKGVVLLKADLVGGAGRDGMPQAAGQGRTTSGGRDVGPAHTHIQTHTHTQTHYTHTHPQHTTPPHPHSPHKTKQEKTTRKSN